MAIFIQVGTVCFRDIFLVSHRKMLRNSAHLLVKFIIYKQNNYTSTSLSLMCNYFANQLQIWLTNRQNCVVLSSKLQLGWENCWSKIFKHIFSCVYPALFTRPFNKKWLVLVYVKNRICGHIWTHPIFHTCIGERVSASHAYWYNVHISCF